MSSGGLFRPYALRSIALSPPHAGKPGDGKPAPILRTDTHAPTRTHTRAREAGACCTGRLHPRNHHPTPPTPPQDALSINKESLSHTQRERRIMCCCYIVRRPCVAPVGGFDVLGAYSTSLFVLLRKFDARPASISSWRGEGVTTVPFPPLFYANPVAAHECVCFRPQWILGPRAIHAEQNHAAMATRTIFRLLGDLRRRVTFLLFHSLFLRLVLAPCLHFGRRNDPAPPGGTVHPWHIFFTGFQDLGSAPVRPQL